MAVGRKLPMGVPPSSHLSAVTNSNGNGKTGYVTIGLPPPLLLEEKKFLLAVERGDIPNVRRILQKAHRKQHININCMDPLGRRALTLSIDNENLEMVELLIIMGVETTDALLHAINAEFIEAVELLLEHEELIHKEGELYSWQKVDINMAVFPPDITPLMLAAHKNNFEILKILLDRGAAVPVPHDIRCGCDECVRMSSQDSLRHSLSRVNMYRALASPSLICLTSTDPILTAFQLSWELRNLAFTEQECKSEYLELRRQCQKFAVDLLDQTRTSNELAIILNYDPEIASYEPGDRMGLTRLVQAISYKQKKFVSHSNVQQLLSALWYDGLPGFRRKTVVEKFLCIVRVAVLFPLYCVMYMLAPNFQHGQLMRKPFMKFLIHASSYLFFLFILILVSQRADDEVIKLLGTARMKQELAEEQMRQRGRPPTKLEFLVVLYVFGFIWEEIQEIFTVGMNSYLRNLWNFIDFLRNGLYVGVICLRTFAYIQQLTEISQNHKMAFIPREQWNDYDAQLIAEGLFAAANVFSALKLVHLFSINPHLGPLQISLGRMVIDIVKFFSIYSLVLFAFACGLNQLLWYFADLEKDKCYALPNGEADWGGNGDSCMKWRRFGNLFESSQSLFWASFGMIGLENFELTGIKSYTRFWGLLMFGSYSVINVIVLLNLLIAMMSNSYAMIDEHSDTEWKFARTKLWMSFFEDSPTLPPPFNIMPSVKWLIRVFRKSSKEIDRKRSKKRYETQSENTYENIMRALVWRYVSAQHRKFEVNPVTEDDINEVKCEISTMRYEMLEIFENSGMDCTSANKKEKPVRAKRNKDWERRLMRDFNVQPIQLLNESNSNHNMYGHGDMNEIKIDKDPSKLGKETPKERFRRVARTVASQSATGRWSMVYKGVAQNSQIGRCYNRETFKNLRQLGQAIEEAKKLILVTPPACSGRESPIRIEFEDERTSTLLELLNQISDELGENFQTPAKAAKQLPFKNSILQNKPPCDIQVKSIIKEDGVDQLNKQKFDAPIRAATQPEIQVPKVATFKTAPTKTNQPSNNNKSNEPILSASKLMTATQSKTKPPPQYTATTTTGNKSNNNMNANAGSIKKAAPAIPGNATQMHTHKPFAVELGHAGRYHGYGSAYDNTNRSNPNTVDLTFVDIDERDQRYYTSGDDTSEVASIATMNSPTRGRSLTKSISIESDKNDRSQSGNRNGGGGVKSKDTGAISKKTTNNGKNSKLS